MAKKAEGYKSLVANCPHCHYPNVMDDKEELFSCNNPKCGKDFEIDWDNCEDEDDNY